MALMLTRDKNSQLRAVPPDKLDRSIDSESQYDEGKSPVRVEFNHEHRKGIFLLILVLSVLLVAWSWFTELNEIAEAPGQLIPSQEVQSIRATFDSKVTSILVKAGAAVKKGDLLLTLDAETYNTELEKNRHELKIGEQELEQHNQAYKILTAYLLDGRILPGDLSSILPVAKAIGDLYAARQRLQRAQSDMSITKCTTISGTTSELSILKSQHHSAAQQRKLKELALSERRNQFEMEEQKVCSKITALENKLELQTEAVEHKRKSLEGTEKQLEAYERVFQSGGSSRTECLDARMRVDDRKKDLTVAVTASLQMQGELLATKHELTELKSRNSMELEQMQAALGDIADSSAQISTRMRSEQRALLEAQTEYQVALQAARSMQINETNEITERKKHIEQLKAASTAEQHTFEKGAIRSPVEGTVALVNLQGPGEVVQRAQNLLTIVPSKDPVVACLHVANEQVPFIHNGDIVQIQFPAYPYQQYGTIPAKVTMIDKYPSQEKEYANSYKVLLAPMRDWIMCRGKRIPLRKGLEAQGQLVLRKRRLLISMLAPLLKLQYAHFKA